MDCTQLKQAIADVIKTNGQQEITGQLLQDALFAIIDTLNNGKQDTLVDDGEGANIKTVNGTTILGGGDLSTTYIYRVTIGTTPYSSILGHIAMTDMLILGIYTHNGKTQYYSLASFIGAGQPIVFTCVEADTIYIASVDIDNNWTYTSTPL